MAPLSFSEFLRATGKDATADILASPPIRQPDVIHRMMLDEVRQYMFVGGMPMDAAYAQQDLLAIHQGAMAEQFVGQELAAAGHSELHYWAREAKSSSAEVDFLVVADGQICPVEGKSGAAGRLRSLRLLMDTYPNCRTGYVLSCAPYVEAPEQQLVFLPLYYAGTLRA